MATNAERVKAFYARNPGYVRNANLKRCYGITLDDYDIMLVNQDGVCAICKGSETARYKDGRIKNLAVDHCHKTGRIRQLLCSNCNQVLASAKDNPEILYAAIDYLERVI